MIPRLLLWASLLSGCTFSGAGLRRADALLGTNAAALAETSRVLTTGALDSLQLAPTNPPVDLARSLLRADQQIEGVPVRRLDVSGVLSGDTAATGDLRARMVRLDGLLEERVRLEARVAALTSDLVEMGRKYEQERNRGILRRVTGWLGLGGTVAAVVALFVFFPPSIAIAGHLLGWVVNRLPGMASTLGVVSVKAFDGVVAGVERAKAALGRAGTSRLEENLRQEMDRRKVNIRRVVRARKVVLT